LATHLYRLAGPRIGCRFLESTYLLCLGDMRPYAAGNGYLPDPRPEDALIIDRLNAYLIPRGLSLHARKPDAQGRVQAFSLRSLRGLERRTQSSQLDWVPRYLCSQGWPGYYQWKSQIWKHMPDRASGYDRVEGIMLGYPDSAVAGYPGLAIDGPEAVQSQIAGTDQYLCDQPNFWLRWPNTSAPDVATCEQEWGDFLTRAYASATHQQLAQDPVFLRARQRVVEQNPQLFGSERRRLGLEVVSSPLRSIDRQQENWFRQKPARLWEAVAQTADLSQIAELAGGPRLNGHQIAGWLRRGQLGQDPLAAELTQLYSQRHPLAWTNFLKSPPEKSTP